jgi:hypothetical protein
MSLQVLKRVGNGVKSQHYTFWLTNKRCNFWYAFVTGTGGYFISDCCGCQFIKISDQYHIDVEDPEVNKKLLLKNRRKNEKKKGNEFYVM